MKHVFFILPQKKLIVECFASKLGLDDYKTFKKQQLGHPDYSPEYNVLSDLRWSEFDLPPNDIDAFAVFFKANVKLDAHRKGCLLTFEPLQTAYSMIFKKRTAGNVVSWKVCTTLEEALSWLHFPLSFAELDAMLEDLKEKRNLP